MPVFGWDASDYDWGRGPMDVAAAARAGIQFFTHKATESTNVKHIYFGEAMARARDAGIPILGGYHVVRSPRNAQAEVDYFLNYVDRSFPEWRTHPAFFIQVDLEKWAYDSVPAAEGEDFADLAEAQTGKTAIIYASKGQYGNDLAGTSHELWNANYPLNYQTGDFRDLYRRAGGDNGPGWASYSGRVPVFWQYTSSATIGDQPGCDANAYRGTVDQLRALVTGTPAPKGPSMIQVKSGPSIVLTDWATWCDRTLTYDQLQAMLPAVPRVEVPDAILKRILALPQPDAVSADRRNSWLVLEAIRSGAPQVQQDTGQGIKPFDVVPSQKLHDIADTVTTLATQPTQGAAAPTQDQVDAAVRKGLSDPAIISALGAAVASHIHVS